MGSGYAVVLLASTYLDPFDRFHFNEPKTDLRRQGNLPYHVKRTFSVSQCAVNMHKPMTKINALMGISWLVVIVKAGSKGFVGLCAASYLSHHATGHAAHAVH